MPNRNSVVPDGWLGRLAILAVGILTACWPLPLAAEECATCHSEIAEKFSALSHGRAFRFDKAFGSAACESCHGPGQEHADGGGDITKILVPSKGDAVKANGACLACHENSEIHTFWQASAHEAAGLRCADCHSVHSVPAPKEGTTRTPATELCLSCHAAERKGLSQRSRHPLNEGKMDCVSCHDPHGTASESMVRGDSVNDLCYSCHEEKRGPFLWEHAPVREDCRTCHTPHGSNHDKMLVSRTVQVCQSCHLQGRHQTVAGVPEAFWNQNRQCVNCHAQIHGSNHPSGPLFQR